jgi:hypothetical protein
MPEKTITIQTQGASGAFASLLSGMKRGAVIGDLDESLKELVAAINKSGKAGELTLKLKITPEARANEDDTRQYTITENIGMKKPRKTRGKCTFFGDEEGNLLRDDPNQSEMKFGSIEGGKADAAPTGMARAANG